MFRDYAEGSVAATYRGLTKPSCDSLAHARALGYSSLAPRKATVCIHFRADWQPTAHDPCSFLVHLDF